MTTGISFTDQFVCSNKDCSYNCCGGWQIEVDEETYHKYLDEEGAFGRELRRNIYVKDVPQIKQRFHKCPYLTKDKLCGMYLTHGEEYMSFACRMFPRRKIAYEVNKEPVLEELYLELSCPEVAKLFLQQEGFMQFGEVERQTETCWNFEIEEMDYFEKLLLMRNSIRQIMEREDIQLAYCLMLAFDYAEGCQQLAMRLQYEEIGTYTEQFLQEEAILQKIAEYEQEDTDLSDKGSLLHKFVAEGVEQIDIWFTNPGMAKLLRHYYHYFNNKDFSKFGKIVRKKQKCMLEKQGMLEKKYRNYFLYYIHQRLLYAIQSYNMTKPIIMGIIHTQMLILFDIIVWMKGKEQLPDEKQIEVLAYYSRTAGHNESICDKIYEFVSKSKDMRELLANLVC